MAAPKIDPLPLLSVPEPFDDPAFIYELKHDGWRALAYLQRGRPAELVSRTGHIYTRFRPLAAAVAAALPCKDAILDGEICVFDDTRPLNVLRDHAPPRRQPTSRVVPN